MSAAPKYYYDQEAADRAVEWIETYCTHTDGSLLGQPLILEPFQKKIIREAFGWKQTANGFRKYTKVYVEIPRGNGKSALGTAIALYLLLGDKEGAAELYACAGSKDQAKKIFDPARIMVNNSPDLSSILKVQRNSIYDEETWSFFQVVSADAKLQHGHKPHGVLFDELHVQPDDKLWESFVTAMKKRNQPMMWVFTTAGVAGSFAEEIHDYAIKIRDRVIEDDTFLPFIFAAEKDDDPFDPQTWKKANPAWNFINQREFEASANEARNSPARLNSFLQLHLNIWTSSSVAWMPIHEWDKCYTQPVTLDALAGKEVYLGLDMASVRDLTSLAIYVPENGDCFWLHFCPQHQIHERSAHNISYDKWVHDEWMIPVPGNAIDSGFVLSRILRTIEKMNVKMIAYDRKFVTDVINGLVEEGYEDIVHPFGQGFISMNAPMKELEKMILNGNINHGNNPVTRWQITNVEAVLDDAGNIKPSKKKSKDKIDGIVALIMAIGGWMNFKAENVKKKPKYRQPHEILR